MSTSEHRTRRLLLCCLAFVLGAVAGWVFVEVVWHGLTPIVPHGFRPLHPPEYYAFSLISTLSGAMIGWGLALPRDEQDA